MKNNQNDFSIDGLISGSSEFQGSSIPSISRLDEENVKNYQLLFRSFTRHEIAIAWIGVLSLLLAYLGCFYSGIEYASLKHARILYAVFVAINVIAALQALFAWAKIPSKSVAKDAMLFLMISMICAAIGNSLDFIFWVTEIAAFKQSVFTNLFFIFAILFAMPGVHLLGRVCRVEFSKQPILYYLAIISIYLFIPIFMNYDSFSSMNNLSNFKEFIFGMLYAVGIGYLAAVSIHLWRTAQGRLVFSAKLISVGLVAMSFGCSIYAGLFPRIPSSEIPSSPVHIIIALGYIFSACGIKRTESTINSLFNLKDTRLPPWLTLVELFGKSEGLEVYKRLEENVKTTVHELIKAKEETQQKQEAISDLEQEIKLRKETERALIFAKEKAEEASRAKSQFLAMMSHELKTPLTAIKGYGELLKGPGAKNLVESKKLENIASQIVINADSLHGMIEGVLNFSQLESAHFTFRKEVFLLEDVLSYIHSIVQEQKNSLTVSYTENIPDTRLKLETDKHSLQHILVNLIVNAFKFCTDGRVSLEIRKSGNSDLFIAVEDTGIGIASEHLDKIFQAFYQVSHGTKRKYGGTGLGLSIVKKIVIELQGKIDVESKPEKGTRFEVFLPAVIYEGTSNE